MGLAPARAAAQDAVIARARAERAGGRPQSALALLIGHLQEAPRDVDARLLYGLMLSWDGRYDEARSEFRRVLEQAPAYLDAKVALMNVEWWSGNSDEARHLVDQVLSRDPGNAQARLVQQRLDARTRPWTASVMYGVDGFNDGRASWQDLALSLGRETPVGSLIVRHRRAERFALADEQVEIEFYPRFRAGSYAYIGIGLSQGSTLFPTYRVGADLYQGLGGGLEMSVGFRRLAFATDTDIFVASLTKYISTWMVTGRLYRVPDDGPLDSTSFHGQVRRYYGGSGTSFVGLTYGHGLAREELASSSDLVLLDSRTLSGELEAELSTRLRLNLSGGFSRQERVGSALWQRFAGGGLYVRF
jgi:YaiO family outer membrane protein